MKAFLPLLFALAACSSAPSSPSNGRLDSLYGESTRLHKVNRQIMDSIGAIMQAKRAHAEYVDDSTYQALERRRMDNELQIKRNSALIDAAK